MLAPCYVVCTDSSIAISLNSLVQHMYAQHNVNYTGRTKVIYPVDRLFDRQSAPTPRVTVMVKVTFHPVESSSLR